MADKMAMNKVDSTYLFHSFESIEQLFKVDLVHTLTLHIKKMGNLPRSLRWLVVELAFDYQACDPSWHDRASTEA